MGKMVTGYYVLAEQDTQILVTRRVTVLCEKYNPETTIIKTAHDDPLYLKAVHPSITPIMEAETSSVLVYGPEKVVSATGLQIKIPQIKPVRSECSKCAGPLKPYGVLLATNVMHCPWCKSLLLNVRSADAERAAAKGAKATPAAEHDPDLFFLYDFDFPYGFHLPPLLSIATLQSMPEYKAYTEDNAREIIGYYYEALNL